MLSQYYVAVEAGEATRMPGNHGDDIVGVEVTVPTGQVSIIRHHPGEERQSSG